MYWLQNITRTGHGRKTHPLGTFSQEKQDKIFLYGTRCADLTVQQRTEVFSAQVSSLKQNSLVRWERKTLMHTTHR